MQRVLAGLAVLVLVFVVAALGFVLSFDVDRYKNTLVAMVAERSGRAFAIDGDIRFVPALVPTIAVEGVRIGNAAWDTRGDMVAIKHIEARVALRPLLSRRIEIKRVAVTGATVNLAINAAGERNWALTLPSDAGKGPIAIAALTVDEVTFENVAVHYAGAADAADAIVVKAVLHSRPGAGIAAIGEVAVTAADVEYRSGPRVVKLGLDTIKAGSAAPGDPVVVALAGTYGETPLKLRAALGTWAHVLAAARMPFDIDGSVGGVRVHLRGEADLRAGLNGIAGTVELDADDGAALGALLGVAIPAVAPATIKAELVPGDQHIAFRQLAAKLGRSDLAGEGSLALAGPRPRIRGSLTAERIDLTEFSPAPIPVARATRLISTTPLALEGLKSLDYSGSVRIGALKTHGISLTRVQADVSLVEGRLTLAPATAAFAGGTLDVRMSLSAGEVARLELDLRGNGIVPAQLPQLTGKPLIEGGRTNLQFKLAGSGRSPADLLGGGNGQLLVRVGPGVLPQAGIGAVGADLVLGALNGLNPLAARDPRTRLECAVLNFDIVNGLASTEHGIAFRTDKLNVLGGGTVDLKTERIDIGARPKPREGVGLNLAAIGDFVRLGGTLSKPVPVTDAQGMATAGIKVGAAMATGGLSLLAEGLFDRATGDEDVCAIAAGEQKLPSATTATAGTAQAPSRDEPSVIGKASETTKNAVQGVGNAVKGVFKGLFGR